MTASTKAIITVGVLVILGAIYGAYHYPQAVQTLTVGASPAGSTFGTAKFAGVVINLASPGSTGTSTSITNSDANDRYVQGWAVACEGMGTSRTAVVGTGLAALLVSIGTTTTSAPASFSSSFPLAALVTVPTSTPNLLIASSSVAINNTATNSMVWGTGTAMTFYFNATNTAVCTVGVNYIAG